MIQDIEPRNFSNKYENLTPQSGDTVFTFRGQNRQRGEVLCRLEGDSLSFPKMSEMGELNTQYLFSIDDDRFFLNISDEYEIPEGYEFMDINVVRKGYEIVASFAGMTAFHLFMFYRESRFCGVCGTETVHSEKLRMKQCPKCGQMHFPKVAPAVIIGLRKGDSLMVSHYANREYKGQALLAGFCEIGETPEQTVIREVYEEVGLKAVNVEYFGSQPWGLDANLLLGYFCDLEGNDSVKLDEEELASAGFVKRDEITQPESLHSLTATMIDAFIRGER